MAINKMIQKRGLTLTKLLIISIVIVGIALVGVLSFSLYNYYSIDDDTGEPDDSDGLSIEEETFECSDGLDNDEDGFIDYPSDFGCSFLEDNSEVNNGNTQCSDGIDNDFDGLIDQEDTECASALDNSESSLPSGNGGNGNGNGNGNGGETCHFTSSFWSVSQASDGDLIYLVVEGDSNCAGETTTFEIFDNNSVLVNTIGSIGLINSRAVASWVVGTGDGGGGNGLILPLILEASLVFFAFTLIRIRPKDRKTIAIIFIVLILVVSIGLSINYYYGLVEEIRFAPLVESYHFVATLDSNSAVVANSEVLLLSEFEFLDLTERTLVVYNENYPDQDNNSINDALEIAQHYAIQRGIDLSRLCGVQLPTGQYGSADELLGARKTIVEQCICSNVLGLETCDMNDDTFLDTIIEQSPITHMAIIRGIPARLTETGWISDFEDPSFDYYLSYLIYSNDSIFEGIGWFVVPPPYVPSGGFFGGYLGPLNVQDHRFVAYGRVEAITKERTFDLIDRTLSAEQNGFTGNLLSERIFEHNLLAGLSSDFDSVCTDYLSYEPFIFGNLNSSWPYQQCRAGTTDSTSNDSRPKQIPGEINTVIPFAINAGVFLGTHHGEGGPASLENHHHAFDDFSNMLNWHKSEEDCTELCSEFPTEQERNDCVAASTDYFKEINTECVGVAPGFMAFQLRSWPVQFYGFIPNGWRQVATGTIDKTMPVILQGGAFTNANFTDDKYAHFGTYDVNNSGSPTCTLEDGSQVSCPERIGIHLIRTINIPETLVVDGFRQFRAVIRHRNPQNPIDAKFPLRLRIFNQDLGVDRFMTRTIPMSDANPDWHASEWIFTVNTSVPGFENYTNITALQLRMQVKLDHNITGFFDMDGIEVIDMETGNNLFDIDAGSFNISQTENTVGGDWPGNVIDRIGGIASWGSSSHHRTGGFAFSNALKFIKAFYSGRTLGETLVYVDNAYSGIIYGDPLYNPSAVKIFGENNIPLGTYAGFLLWKDTLDSTGLFINVLHGNNNTNNTQWALEKCGNDDLILCHVDGLWTPWQEGTKARYEKEVSGFAFDFIDDLGVSKDFAVKLRVWNFGEEESELDSYAFVKYVAQDFASCPTDVNGDGIVDSEDRSLIIRQCTEQELEYDFNGDGVVDSLDLQILQDNWGPCPDEPAECPWDIDGDGTVGNSDLFILLIIIPCTSEVLPNEYDINLDGVIDNEDRYIVQLTYGMCDTDGDGILGGEDNCPVDYNPEQEDSDEDGIGDVCDICPDSIHNDLDGDGLCEGVDPDDDGDGVLDDGADDGEEYSPCPIDGEIDNCDDNCLVKPNGPLLGTCTFGFHFGGSCTSDDQCGIGVCNMDQEDSDGDGIGDVCDF